MIRVYVTMPPPSPLEGSAGEKNATRSGPSLEEGFEDSAFMLMPHSSPRPAATKRPEPPGADTFCFASRMLRAANEWLHCTPQSSWTTSHKRYSGARALHH